jgi:SAM-dependent methyltransferase
LSLGVKNPGSGERVGKSPNELRAVASAYNEAGGKYLAYADGDPSCIFEFGGRFSYGDRVLWSVLDQKLRKLRCTTATLRVLDLGCGPGTWLRRIVTHALNLGYTRIEALGTDIADRQIRCARYLSRRLARRGDVELSFQLADIRDRLPLADKSVDLCLCLYTVLNHLPKSDLPQVFKEIARVTAGEFVSTVRSSGSVPTIFVGPVESARHFHQDNQSDHFDVDLNDGRHASFDAHLFTADELAELAGRHLSISDIRGLDLFHSRFAKDSRWNPPNLVASDGLVAQLDRIEAAFCRDPDFIDYATHLLLIAGSSQLLTGDGT